MAALKFQFEPEIALDAIAYLLHRLGPLDKVKLTKLLYLADRQHFLAHGHPITGDRQCAMDFGPLPSRCLSLINGEPLLPAQRVFSRIHVDDNRVSLRDPADPTTHLDALSQATLDAVIAEYGRVSTFRLSRQLHRLPEFEDVYEEGTSRTITYERIAELTKDAAPLKGEVRFSQGRVVVTPEAAARMNCPYPPGDDL